MCGFVGMVHWDDEPVAHDELDRAIGSLRHRGPDELCSVHPIPGVGLAHARLKVIDLSEAARQPMGSEDGLVWLVYNGEVYNFPELRRELEAAGHRFRSRSDTEVVLRAYQTWGTEAFHRLQGMFALGIWDARHRQLILARDRVGKKPLFYWTDGRCVVFGSEVKALLAHRHVSCEVDEAALRFLLTFGYPPTGSTCYRHIRQLPPATFLCVSAQSHAPVPQPYWDLSLTPTPGSVTTEKAAQELRRLLQAAVRRRLTADVPVGAFLSGGVDSTIIVGLMANAMAGRPIRTFSIGFEGDTKFDETTYSRIAAKRFQTEHTVFRVGPQPFTLVEQLVWYHDQPFGDSSALPTYLLCRLTREHVTVALSGDGGDELFGGYDRFRASLWAERLPRGGVAVLDRILKRVPAPHERSLLDKLKRFVDGARLELPGRYLRWVSYFPDACGRSDSDESGGTDAGHLPTSLETVWQYSVSWSTLARLLYLNFKEYLPNDLMVKADRCSMAHGLELRSPLLDTAVIEYVAGLPNHLKCSAWRTKVLLKRACRDLLPPAIHQRRKMGFGVPLGTWFRRQWREPIRDVLGSSDARLWRYVPMSGVQALLQRHLEGREDGGHRLWLLLTVELWLRQVAHTTMLFPQGSPRVVHLETAPLAKPAIER